MYQWLSVLIQSVCDEANAIQQVSDWVNKLTMCKQLMIFQPRLPFWLKHKYLNLNLHFQWTCFLTNSALALFVGGHMTTLKGDNIDYTGTPVNKGGLVASVGVDHKAILAKLPNWDPEKHWKTQTQSQWKLSHVKHTQACTVSSLLDTKTSTGQLDWSLCRQHGPLSRTVEPTQLAKWLWIQTHAYIFQLEDMAYSPLLRHSCKYMLMVYGEQ